MIRAAALLLCLTLVPTVSADPTIGDFKTKGKGTPFLAIKAGAAPGPAISRGSLWLLNGMRSRGPLSNAIAFDRTAAGCHRKIEARMTFSMSRGAHGGALALLSTAKFGVKGPPPAAKAWEEPNLPGSFAIGLDTYNPPTQHWFDAQGNVHAQPQREVSLHFDGRELACRLSPVEFRDGKGHELHLVLQFVPGGAQVTVRIDGKPVFDDAFMPGVTPYECRVALGGRTGRTTTNFMVGGLRVDYSGPGEAVVISPSPLAVKTFDGEVIHGKHQRPVRAFDLPAGEKPFARIVLSLSVAPPPGGWDTWDRKAAVYVVRGEGETQEQIEILRWITPFARRWTWHADVTDFAPLLRGKTRLGLFAETWTGKAADPAKQKGFKVSVVLRYYPGTPRRVPLEVVNLWNVNFGFGNDQAKIDAAFAERTPAIPEGATAARVRMVVTGHGPWGEFKPAQRTLTCAGKLFENQLWTTDVYLNPCRPQGGTWKFNRAGWAPGDVVRPWTVDVSDLIQAGKPLPLRYRPLAWKVPPGTQLKASHWVASQLIIYR